MSILFHLILYYPFSWQCFELQSMYTTGCKYWVLPLDTILPLQLQPDSGSSCNWYTRRVANTKCFRLIFCTTPSVAIEQWIELQSMYTPSCKYWVLQLDTVLLIKLQPDSGSYCNWYTLRVANTECFRLILYYPFHCNRIAVWVVIDAHSELRILSASAWYCTIPLVEIVGQRSPNEVPPGGEWQRRTTVFRVPLTTFRGEPA
jgi:hypothetical protein